MKILISIAFILSFSALHAQQSVEKDTLSEKPIDKFHFYIAPAYSSSQFVETFASQVALSAGIIYKNRLDLSVCYGVVIDNFKKRIIFPRFFTYGQMNGGLYLNYYFTNRRLRPLAGLGTRYAHISWSAEEGIKDEYSDRLFIYDAYLGGIWQINDAIALQANIGYTFSDEVKIIGLETEDFQGIKFDMAINIRLFSF